MAGTIQKYNTNTILAAKKTHHFTITKISRLILFQETIAVYSENHSKHISKKCRVLTVKAGGTYSYHWDLKG
jgi:hypothetical protein